MDLSELRTALRRYWAVALLAFEVWVLIGVAMSFLPASQYRATATVAVTAPPTLDNATSVASYQIPIIVARLQSRRFVEQVQADLPAAVADADVSIEVANDTGTGILRIRAQGEEPEALAAWATAVAAAAAAENDPSGLELSIIDEAGVPGTPVSPRPIPILLGTGVLGVLSAVLASVIVYRVRKALSFEDEIQRRLALPVLGHIPAVSALRRAPGGAAADVLVSTPQLMESFKTLRTNLELTLMDAPESSALSIVSWGEGEGKSTVAAGIALTPAMSGADVIAADADLRHPRLHTLLGQPFGEGMADVSPRTVAGLVRPTEYPHLWFVPAGIPDRHPADVLPVTMRVTLDHAATSRRRLVVDCPPLHGVAETAMVVAATHNAVLVVDGKMRKLPELEGVVGRLRSAGVNIVGVVLNRTHRSKVMSAYPAFEPRAEVSPSIAPLTAAVVEDAS